MSPHRRRKGHQVPFVGIGSFSRPKARYGLVDEDPFFCVFFFFLKFQIKGKKYRTVKSGLITGPKTVRSDRGSHGSLFFSVERFLKLKEPQKGAVRGFSGRTVRSGPDLKTMTRRALSLYLSTVIFALL